MSERILVLGAYSEEISARVYTHGVRTVVCDDWAEGLGASLRTGLDALAPQTDAVVVILGDQPRIAARAIAAVIAARGDAQAVRATYDGRPGQPVLIERELFPRLREISGDVGARDVLKDARVRDVPCDGLGDPSDVDTPDDLPA